MLKRQGLKNKNKPPLAEVLLLPIKVLSHCETRSLPLQIFSTQNRQPKFILGRRLYLYDFLDSEVSLCVVERYVADYFLESIHIRRIQTLLDHIAYETAEDSAEILMSGIRQERTGVRDHADKL